MKASSICGNGRLRTLMPFVLMAALYGLSSLPGTPLPHERQIYGVLLWIPPSVQNVLHIPVYAALAGSWYLSLRYWPLLRARAPIAFAVTVAYGIFDEWHQSFVPGRYGSLGDVLLNVIGATVGIALAVRFERRRRGAGSSPS